jgi:hypothetical protein
MNRRNFLQSMFAAAMAPAICKAENLMKIYVPNRDIQIINSFGADSMKFDGCGDYIPFSDNPNDYVFGDTDWSMEFWVKTIKPIIPNPEGILIPNPKIVAYRIKREMK